MTYALKRKRGAPPGNQNARKHGFYSGSLTTSEICEFLNITNFQHTDREIAIIRVKLKSALQQSPRNHRVLMEAARLLVKFYSAKYQLNRQEKNQLKNLVRFILAKLPGLSYGKPVLLQNKSGTL